MTTHDDDVSYLDVKPEDMVLMPPQEKVWAKISEDGKLEYIDWALIEGMAAKFDELNAQKKDKEQNHVICKLLVLVREQVRHER